MNAPIYSNGHLSMLNINGSAHTTAESKLINKPETVLRRRAIYTGMRPYVDDAKLLDAIKLWQAEYSHKPKFALSVFVARCCDSPEHKEARANVLKSIFIAMELQPDALLPDPFLDLKVVHKTAAGNPADATQQTKMFVVLMQQVFAKLQKADEKQVRLSIQAHLPELRTDRMRMMYLREWLAGSTQTLEGQFDLELLQKLVNCCYMAICQQLGPVKADQYLGQAIKETEPLAMEVGFKLHDLL